MLSSVEWGEYRIGDLFESCNGDFDIQKRHINGKGEYVITAGQTNNGVLGRSDVSARIFPSGTLTVDMFGYAYYRSFEYRLVTHARVFSLMPKFDITPPSGLFISNTLHYLPLLFGYENMCSWAKIKDEHIQLPTRDGKIDFMFMERFVAELKAQRVAELKAYLTVTGLSDYTLTPEEQQAIQDFQEGNLQWCDYRLTSVFEVKNAGNILSSEVVAGSGSTPYLCASRENNAVSSYVSYKDEMLSEGNCIFIGGKTFVVTYQEKDFFSNDSHNLILRLYEAEHRTKRKQLYLTTCIDKSLRHRYSWGDSISNKKIQADKVTLPTSSDKLDYTQMETFIRAIEKLVIRDVVLYADRELAATQQVINQ